MDTSSAGTAAFSALAEAASLAPSSHNTQPWLFRRCAGGIELLADRTRALPVNDPSDRELTISCGCALMNVRVAAAAAGLQPVVELMPDAADEDLLARVRLAVGAGAQPLADMASAIPLRRTCRQRFSPAAVDPEVLASLAGAVEAEGATLVVLDSPEQRLAAARLVAEGDSLQWANASWRRELAAWMHPRRRGDGLTLPELAIPVARMVVRTFDMGKGVAARDREVADGSPVLAVMATRGDGPRDWVTAGQALQRLLLVAVQRGLQASYLNQPIQAPGLRLQLQQVAGDRGMPQLLLRLGVPERPIPASPRRRLADIIVSD